MVVSTSGLTNQLVRFISFWFLIYDPDVSLQSSEKSVLPVGSLGEQRKLLFGRAERDSLTTLRQPGDHIYL